MYFGNLQARKSAHSRGSVARELAVVIAVALWQLGFCFENSCQFRGFLFSGFGPTFVVSLQRWNIFPSAGPLQQ